MAKEKFDADLQTQNAIAYHTTGNVNMDRFAKIIYLADKIEENRNYDSIEYLRELAKEDIDQAILFVLDFTIEKSIKNSGPIHPDTIELRNNMLKIST